MYVDWTKHLKDQKDKERFTKEIYGARSVLERLHDIVKEKLDTIDYSETNIKVYDTPNWAERQAHKNGNREALVFLQNLINLDQQKENK